MVTIATIIDEIVTTEITNAAIDKAPIYIPAKQAKKMARKLPAAAKETRRDMTTALKVATMKNREKTSNPVSTRKMVVPTCIKI